MFLFYDIFKYKIKWNGYSKGRGKDVEGIKFFDIYFILINRICFDCWINYIWDKIVVWDNSRNIILVVKSFVFLVVLK